MFWKLRIRPGEDERNIYSEANEYGIINKAFHPRSNPCTQSEDR